MNIAAGDQLGPYLVVAPIGSGGMGEVFLAKDTRLDREVAIKVLPASVAGDPERRGRFEREAKAVAALSHPNILAIHDIGTAHGVTYAVMELLRGQSLRERLAGGALPVRKATETAIHIARGLAAAHDKGLVHRDLKPENVFLLDDGQVKILDFGLAKSDLGGPASDAQTMTSTEPGTVMGTVGYMAPEQVRGQTVDARADLFALGAVLYEMLSGQRAFRRDTAAETMTAILKDDPPDLVETRADLPASLDRIVRHCLEKNPAERFQTARDIAFALETLSGSNTAKTSMASGSTVAVAAMAPARRVSVALVVTAIVVTAAIAAGAGWWLHRPVAPVRKLDLAVENLDVNVQYPPQLSPDGQRVVYLADGALYVRAFDRLDAAAVPDTADAWYPSWSTDGRFLIYVQRGQLVRTALDGAKATALGAVPTDMSGSGATLWMPDGRILLTGADSVGLSYISERGGDVQTVLPIDKKQEIDFHEMGPLPNGGVLFTVHKVSAAAADTIDVYANGVRKTVLRLVGESLRAPRYSPTGHLIYTRESLNPGLWAVKFSLKTLATEGEPFLLEQGASWASLSTDGTMALVRPTSVKPDLTWIGRDGQPVTIGPLPSKAARYGSDRVFALSPDGTRVLIALAEAQAADLWVYDLASRNAQRLTTGAGQAVFPTWAPDGQHAVFTALFKTRPWNLFRVALSGGDPEQLTEPSDSYRLMPSLTPDGRAMLYVEATNEGRLRWRSLDAAGRPVGETGSLNAPIDEAVLSPDGKWIATAMSDNGRNDIFVRAFPPTDNGVSLRRVTSTGCSYPAWMPNGSQLYFRCGSKISAVSVSAKGGGLEIGPIKEIANAAPRDGYTSGFSVAADGRVLILHTTGRDHLAVIFNWPEVLRRIEQGDASR